MKTNPHEHHRKRMKAKYRKQGIDCFHDHEVLELLLYYCYPRRDTNEIAHNMLNNFGSLHNLLESDVDTLMETLKCTENIAILLNLIPSLANRYYRSRWGDKVLLNKVELAAEYAMSLFVGATVEHFYVINLDAKYNLINTSLISKGTINEAAAYPREIAKEILKNNATNAILTHNHPGGTIVPSAADNESTRVLSELLRQMHVNIIDHIIVSGDKYYSYATRDRRRFVKGYDMM